MSNAERDFDLVLFDLDGTLIDSARNWRWRSTVR